MPVEPAQKALLHCLCTEGDLAQHQEGYLELVAELSPDLTPWYRWIEALPAEATEETLLHTFQMLGALTARGHREARAFLDGYVLTGRHWHHALDQYLADGVDLGLEAWSALLERVDDETLARHIYWKIDAPLWDALATDHERVARVLRAEREKRARRMDAVAWSPANYASAELSQRRWRILESLCRQDPRGAVP